MKPASLFECKFYQSRIYHLKLRKFHIKNNENFREGSKMNFKYSELRSKIIDNQYKIKKFACYRNWPLCLQVWKETGDLPLAERFAMIGRKRLESIQFLHSPEETLIGRVEEWKIDPEEQNNAYEKLIASGKMISPGQTGHCEPFYDEIFSVGLDGIRLN